MEFKGMRELFFCMQMLWTLAKQKKALVARRKALIEAGDIAATDAVDASIKGIDTLLARGNREFQAMLSSNSDIVGLAQSAARYIPHYDEEDVMQKTLDVQKLAFTMLDWMQEIEYENNDGYVETARELFEDKYPFYADWVDWEISGD